MTEPEFKASPLRDDYDVFCAKCKNGPPMAILHNVLDTTAAHIETVLEVRCLDCGIMQPVRLVQVI